MTKHLFSNKEKQITLKHVLKTPQWRLTKRAYVTEAVYGRTHAQTTAHRHGHTLTQTTVRLSPRAAAKQRNRHRPSQRNIHIRRPYRHRHKLQIEN